MPYTLLSCGCYTRSLVTTLYKCPEHGGSVVYIYDKSVERKRYRDIANIRLLNDMPVSGMKRFPDESIGLLISYPDHFPFNARQSLQGLEFLNFNDTYMQECFRLLKPNGSIVLYVEYYVMASLLYSAAYSGFNIAYLGFRDLKLNDPINGSDFLNRNCPDKVIVCLRKDEHKVNLPKRISSIIKILYKEGAILDTSCIHRDFIKMGSEYGRTIGITDTLRYNELVKKKKRIRL